MGDFTDLSKTVQEMEYRRGFHDGYLIEMEREEFLKYTTVEQVNSRIWGWLVRKRYKKLFNK